MEELKFGGLMGHADAGSFPNRDQIDKAFSAEAGSSAASHVFEAGTLACETLPRNFTFTR